MPSGFFSKLPPSNMPGHMSSGSILNSETSSLRGLNSGSETPASLWGVPNASSNTTERRTRNTNFARSEVSLKSVDLRSSLAEQELLREVILSLSGASGTLVQFNPMLDAFVPTSNLILSPSTQSNVLRICECGWLHTRIRQFVDGVRAEKMSGKLILALALAIDEQLNEYYRLVATLEAQLNSDQGVGGLQDDPIFNNNPLPPTSRNGSQASLINSNANDPPTQQPNQPLTLTRLMLWLQEPKRRLKLLASLCDACNNKKGGALASQVYIFSENGYSSLHLVMQHILVNVTRALHEMIASWIYDGKLNDLNQEFFVAMDPTVKNERMWYEKYSLRKSMVPEFISLEQAKKILLTGKSVNFLMHVCGESHNLHEREDIRKTRLTNIESIFEQEFSQSFEKMISAAYTHISRRLLDTLLSEYHFMDHLKATRKFLLLGQGDFIQRLMDLLEPELVMPANNILLHHLGEILETAIRDTNAQYEEPEILQRLDVQMLEISDGDSGWDVFSLEYIVNGPLMTIFTPDCRLSYLKAFNFLWRAKRMEFTLNVLWREQLILARLPNDLNADLTPVFHVVQLLGSEIRHLVQQLQYYINFEALECAWESLVKKIDLANDLDDVIKAHQNFLSSVISSCLLDADSRKLICQLRAIFDLIINFSELHEDMASMASTEHDARSNYQKGIDASAKFGKWGICKLAEREEKIRRNHFVENAVSPLVARLRVLASSYREMVSQFLEILQSHRDANLRLLSLNLNFNFHYSSRQENENSSLV